MTRPIIFDCDGVLLDWLSGFGAYLRDAHGITVQDGPPRDFLLSSWMGVTDLELVRDCVHRFNRNEGGYFAELEPVHGAVEGVAFLRAAGHGTSVLTQCNPDPETVRARCANLDRVFGSFGNVEFVERGVPKSVSLQTRDPSWFVEDNLANAHMGLEAGHDTILIDLPHNRIPNEDRPDLRRVQDWDGILDTIMPAPAVVMQTP